MMQVKNTQYCTLATQDQLECLHIEHPNFFAEICLQGGQLTQFKHKELGDFVWLSPTAEYKTGQSLRGGIPICWPWFGVLEKNPQAVIQNVNGPQGSHGFARTAIWQLSSIAEEQDGVIVELTLSHDEKSLAIWPFKFSLTCRFHLGDQLKVELIHHNLDSKTVHYSQALHTYFPIKHITQTQIEGAEDCTYVDALDNWQRKTQQGHILFTQETDRVYLGDIAYSLNAGTHTFNLLSNSQSSVVWNPWIDKSKTLSQFPNDAYQSMVCIENGNILDDIVSLEPNQSHTLRMTLSKTLL